MYTKTEMCISKTKKNDCVRFIKSLPAHSEQIVTATMAARFRQEFTKVKSSTTSVATPRQIPPMHSNACTARIQSEHTTAHVLISQPRGGHTQVKFRT